MKKTLALILAVVMVLGMSAVASADDGVWDAEDILAAEAFPISLLGRRQDEDERHGGGEGVEILQR